MITKFKIFENNNTDKYINNFIVIKLDPKEPDYAKGCVYTIYVCSNARKKMKEENIFYFEFDCFDLDKDFNILTPYGSNDDLDWERIEIIPFLSPIEFYNEYTELCNGFYKSLRDNYEKDKEAGYNWIVRMLKNCKDILETLPEFQHYADAEKYNL